MNNCAAHAEIVQILQVKFYACQIYFEFFEVIIQLAKNYSNFVTTTPN
jgi:hypothetical protein